MSEILFEIKIQGDCEGYVTFECPFCESEFKLRADEFQDDENTFTELYCPYCGLTDKINTFYTKDVIDQAEAIATNYMFEEINKAFGKMAKNLNRIKYIKMEWRPLRKVGLKELKDKDTVEEIFECPVCAYHEKVFYCSGVSKIYCSYCGVDI